MWYLHASRTVTSSLGVGVTLRLMGEHDALEIREAYYRAVARHDAFRIRFHWDGTRPVCELTPGSRAAWSTSTLPEAIVNASTSERIADVVREHTGMLDADRGLNVCATLVVGDATSFLVLTLHHLIADARSVRILVEDILAEWRVLRGGVESQVVNDCRYWDILSTFTEQEALCQSGDALSPWRIQGATRAGADRVSIGLRRGAEASCRLSPSRVSDLRRVCMRQGHTRFTGLLLALAQYAAHAGYCADTDIGVVVSNRDMRKASRTVGCFVTLVPVSLAGIGSVDVSQALDLTGRELHRCVHESPVRRVPLSGIRLMVSMVRDSRTQLRAPPGIEIESFRQRHELAESMIHVFFYEYRSNLDIVVNYDAALMGVEAAQAVIGGMKRNIDALSRPDVSDGVAQLGTRLEVTTPNALMGNTWLHHLGLAAWELEIGRRRLQASGVAVCEETVEDSVQGVSLAWAGMYRGVGLELVAPLRDDAPCVSALVRDGEGAYHCCWAVDSMSAVIERLTAGMVRWSSVREEANSPLFVGAKTTFMHVPGIGLVEFIVLKNTAEKRVETLCWGDPLRIEVESADIDNARRFLTTMGYVQARGDDTWQTGDSSHRFLIVASGRGGDGIIRIGDVDGSTASQREEIADSRQWWQRVGICGGETVEGVDERRQ
ncbi:MAG: VOC family protein [Dehalococcoidia bacterium]|nr:VOC family protein [Dehalococcoidia bacterium]